MNLRLFLLIGFFGVCTFLWAQTETPKSDPDRTKVAVTYELRRSTPTVVNIYIKVTKDDKPYAVSVAPSFVIYDESGKKLTEGAFTFG